MKNRMRNQLIKLCNKQKLPFTLFGKLETGALRRSKAVQGGMEADEVVKEEEHGNKVVGRSKRGKALFGLVPCLELFVKALYEVFSNMVVEALHADMLDPMQRLNRNLVGKVTVADNGMRRA